MPSDPPTDALPINPDESMNKQSLHSLRLAEEMGLPVVFRWPIDMADPAHVQRHIAEVGDDNLPEDPLGIYYFYYLISENGERVPIVAAEGEPRFAMVNLAARVGGKELARQFLYRLSLIPR